MRDLNCDEINFVDGGSGSSIASNVAEAGAGGAISGAGLGVAVGAVIGGPPGAAVLGLVGAGTGFLLGMVGYALAQ